MVTSHLEDGPPGIVSGERITPIYKPWSKRPFGKGNKPTRFLGDLWSPWLLLGGSSQLVSGWQPWLVSPLSRVVPLPNLLNGLSMGVILTTYDTWEPILQVTTYVRPGMILQASTNCWTWDLDQWLFLVPLKGGRWHIIPQLAVYTTYIPLIYCLLGGYIIPTTYYQNLKNPLIGWILSRIDWGKVPRWNFHSWPLATCNELLSLGGHLVKKLGGRQKIRKFFGVDIPTYWGRKHLTTLGISRWWFHISLLKCSRLFDILIQMVSNVCVCVCVCLKEYKNLVCKEVYALIFQFLFGTKFFQIYQINGPLLPKIGNWKVKGCVYIIHIIYICMCQGLNSHYLYNRGWSSTQ